MMNANTKWHEYIPGDDFTASKLYEAICTTLLDEDFIEIRREMSDIGCVYRWRITNTCNKVVLYGYPGQELKIILTDKVQ